MKKQQKSHRNRKLIALLVAIACLLAVIYLLAFSKSPSSTSSYKTVATRYYSTEVPESYRVQKATNPEDANMVSLLAHDGVQGGNEIGITTNLLPAGGLPGVPDYNQRISLPSEYTLIKDIGLPEDSKLFYRKDSAQPEYVLYMVHGNRFASILVTGNASSENLEALLMHVAANWQWLENDT